MNDPVESEDRAGIKRLGLLLGQESEVDTETEARGDRIFFCALHMHKVLLIGNTCFSRVSNSRCLQCRYDQTPDDFILVRIIWLLTDKLKDKWEEERRRRP
jgi:hypothetical protein